MTGPAGERLEPVEPGGMRDGDEIIGTPKVSAIRDIYRNVSHIKGLIYLDGLGDVDPDGYTWQRVVADPPLPTTPGQVIRCEIAGGDGRPVVAVSYETAVHDVRWAIAGMDQPRSAEQITRVLYVYPEPGGER